jgi:4-diphosphocytidyl-2-C-methyl-D-erythritol kinase
MSVLTIPAFAKLNLGLRVLGRRPDGYHELRTVFQTISLRDTLVLDPASRRFSFTCRAPGVPEGEENLVHRAAVAYGRAAKRMPRAAIRLIKRIPSQAGLGGGSSDAAVPLIGLNALAGRPLGPERLHEIAASLGSDVPFFLVGGTALGLGRGEILRPLRDHEPRAIVVAVPDFGISTAEAFRRVGSALTLTRGQISIYRFSRQWVTDTGSLASSPNDLETAMAPRHPPLARLLAALRSSGGRDVAMTGSGSAVYGLFEGERKAYKALQRLSRRSQVTRAGCVRTIGTAEYAARVLRLGRGLRSR